MKKGFWKTDWFAGLAICIVFLFASNTALLQSLERAAYDFGVRASSRNPGDKIDVIAIDDESISNLGRWPWPRDILANMIEKLAKGHAKVIGLPIFLSEAQIDPGLVHLRQIDQFYKSNLANNRQASGALKTDIDTLGTKLHAAESALDTDQRLGQSIKDAGNVMLAMQFVPGEPVGKPDKPLPDYVTRNSLLNVDDRVGATDAGLLPLPTLSAVPPIPVLGRAAAGIGHLDNPLDVDGAIRSDALVVRYYDSFYPSLALMIAAKSLNLGVNDIKVNLGEGVQLGRLNIRTDPYLQMHQFFYAGKDGKPAFPEDSFYDVYTGKIPVSKYRNKIVLIGPTAFGVGAPQVTPISAAMAPVMVLANAVASILNEDFFITPSWAPWVQIALFALVAAYLIGVFPRLKAGMAAVISATLLIAILVTHVTLMTTKGMWLQLMLPATLLFVGHLLLTTKRFLFTEKGKLRSEAESADSNRMLGLAFQQQGQLDMAFEKFRKCPLDDSMMDPLYNLALDYERKRQFNKSSSVYNYMADHDPNFRDTGQRRNRSKAMEETVMLGGSGSAAGTLLLDGAGGVQKPMLGRYEVEKELGKGAMGVVYLGRDPKINRVVAIKTMALAQEFEASELEEVKARFFREAETAGRLTHPNIVTIYDAGEEHDLAYIAMEFLKGKDLSPYTKKGSLLPLPKVMGIIFKAADALNYAHSHNVVHRDIKPANVMYQPDSGEVKLTDFGIARITDSSKTKTGMVLGTPSYMSPEQLQGKHVDGRSDLFSLGVMLYQLITGDLPFKGESMATLMYKIANEPYPSLFDKRPDLKNLAPCLAAIVDKALQKDVNNRYQSGAEMGADLRNCAKQIAAAAKSAKANAGK